ncbi:hypothetical protein Scep_026600 [Stephania cephalantha]|uniref:Phytocyanin domain-containing protein n=1 Tax=Stephania cephalantha TaxID=152367 RepID=A0AAP0HSQ1_9MAGN
MANFKLLFLLYVVVGLVVLLSTCRATLYNVGDSAGWDISTDLHSWQKTRPFMLVMYYGERFQYSSSFSVDEVTHKEDFKDCNVTTPISIGSSGNTTIPLTAPGERYFVCGNKLYCLGGMKLDVVVHANSSASAPVSTDPGAAPSSLPRPSGKNNSPVDPTNSFSSSSRCVLGMNACIAFVATTWLWFL